MEFDLIIDLLRSDGSIIVNKKLARSIGLDAAIMYSELLSKYRYFQIREELTNDEFFFNTVENMEHDTTLSKYQQAKAIKQLVDLGLIQNINRGLPQKRYFKIVNDANIIKKYLQSIETIQKSKNSTIRSEKTEQLEVKKLDGNNTKYNNTKNKYGKYTKKPKQKYSNKEIKITAEYAYALGNSN